MINDAKAVLTHVCIFVLLHENFSREKWLNYGICMSPIIPDIAKIVFQSSHTNLYCYQLISSVSLLQIICMIRFLNICQKDGYVIFLIALLSFPNNL